MNDLTPAAPGRLSVPKVQNLVRAFAAIFAMAALTGCDTRGGKLPYDPAGFGPPDLVQGVKPGYEVPLGPLDLLKINVFRVPELSGDFQVDANGNLDLPLIGRVSVREQSAEQFAGKLEALYGERYLTNPDITVRIQSSNQLNITVEGGVNAPGIFALQGKTSLLGAVALARGVSVNDGNAKRVAIIRKVDGQTMAAAFDLVAIGRGEMKDPVVYPGDIIVIESAKVRAIYRDLLQTLPIFAIFRRL